jgi:threonine dehydratase
MPITLQDIQNASTYLQGKIEKTPCLHSRTLSMICGADVYLKFENLQFTSSFKERGALVKLDSLTENERKKGIIAMSAGNHAQAVAYHAQQLGIPAVIVMPRYTPDIKVVHTRNYGAEVILEGETFDDAAKITMEIAKQRALVLVHPYDDEKIITGQGTIALEMLEAHPQLDVLLIPIGGGGLISGIATAAKAIKPEIRIIGVETSLYPSMYNLLHDKQVKLGGSTIAEGIAVKHPGTLTMSIVQKDVDDILLIDEDKIEHAIQLYLEVEKTVTEGAGAIGLAALLQNKEQFSGKNVGLVISGGNIDMPVLASVIQRGLVHSGRLTRVRVQLQDVQGALSKATTCIEQTRCRIVQVHHHRTFTSQPIHIVEVEFILQTKGPEHVQSIMSSLEKSGLKPQLA